MRPSDAVCPSLTYKITDADRHLYLSESELDSLLRREGVYPVGKYMDRLAIYGIEEVIRRHPMIECAECYTTPLYEVKVEISQRTPLLEVRTPVERYFVDTHYRVMPWREQIKDEVLLVTGAVGPQAATTTLAEVAEWLQNDPYWSNRIQSIHMRTPLTAVLILQGDNQPQVILGSLSDYRRKMSKLRTFMDNSAEATLDKHYSELDLRFHGQVVAR